MGEVAEHDLANDSVSGVSGVRLGLPVRRIFLMAICLLPFTCFAPRESAAPPVNDNFVGVGADALSGLTATAQGTIEESTKEAGEPESFNGGTTAGSVWHSWTASLTGTVSVQVQTG